MSESSEVVSLHFGQAGVQLGNALWETMITEHGILNDGTKDLVGVFEPQSENSRNILFHLAPTGRYIPRSLIVDTEPTVIDEIRTGYYRGLFHPDLLISGIEDAANNFARGYYSIGKKYLSLLLEKIRYIIESCNNFKGFVSYSGTAGGTGSGLYSLFFERIMLEFSGKTCIASLILPGKKLNNCIVEPYNTILRISQSIASTDLNILIDNESLFKICQEKMEIYKPTYSKINKTLAPVFSTITAPFRFDGPSTADISELSTNLVPYPRINFPSLSYSPFLSTSNFDRIAISSADLTRDVFNYDNSLLNLDFNTKKIMSSFLVYRGDHQKGSIHKIIETMKKNTSYRWVDWCPTGFKLVQTKFPPIDHYIQIPRSVLMLCNHSGIINIFQDISKKFNALFKKKSFLHWYIGEGMEYDEISNAQTVVSLLQNNYIEACEIDANTFTEKKKSELKSKRISSSKSAEKSSLRASTSKKDLSALKKISSKVTMKRSSSVDEQSSITDFDKLNRKRTVSKKLEHSTVSEDRAQIKKESSELVSKSLKLQRTKSNDKNIESLRSEFIIDNISEDFTKPSKMKERASNEFVFSEKAKEILIDNLSSLSPQMKQRVLGYTNIE